MLLQDIRIQKSNQLKMKGVNAIVKNDPTRGRNKAGGVAICVPRNWEIEEIPTEGKEEILVKTMDPLGQIRYFGTKYSHPNEPLTYDLLNKVKEIAEQNRDAQIIIEGDFNSPSEIWGSRTNSSKGQQLADWLSSTELVTCSRHM